MERRLDIPPAPIEHVRALERRLGVSVTVAQVLVRRGLGEEGEARAWLAAAERHDPSAFAGIDRALALVLDHVQAGSRITVHGDYDVDGVCSTAILVRVLRALGADVDWYLPSRIDDGYGLAAAAVDRLAARGTSLRFSPRSGTQSATVARATRSRSSSAPAGSRPAAESSAAASLWATPVAHRSAHG